VAEVTVHVDDRRGSNEEGVSTRKRGGSSGSTSERTTGAVCKEMPSNESSVDALTGDTTTSAQRPPVRTLVA